MAKRPINVDVQFIHPDTEFMVGKSLHSYFIAFNPYPKQCKHRSKWNGIAPVGEAAARALARHFTAIADQYQKEAQCPKQTSAISKGTTKSQLKKDSGSASKAKKKG